MKKPPQLVLVTWEDACSMDETPWADNKDHKYAPKLFQTVGFLLYAGPEGLILSGSWHEDTVAARDQIPRGMVRKVQKLKA